MARECREALVMVAVTALCPTVALLLGQKDLIAPSALGALLTFRADSDHLPRRRFFVLACAALVVASSRLVAVLCAGVPPAGTAGVVLVWALAFSLFGAVGADGRRIGSIGVVSLILFLPLPCGIDRMLPQCLAALLGSCLTVAARVPAAVSDPLRPARRAVAGYCDGLAAQLRCRRESASLPVWRSRGRLRKARGVAYALLRELPESRAAAGARLSAFLRGADDVSLLDVGLDASCRAVRDPGLRHSVRADAQRAADAAAGALRDCACALCHNHSPLAASPRTDDPAPHFGAVTASTRAVGELCARLGETTARLVVAAHGDPTGPRAAAQAGARRTHERTTITSPVFRHAIRLSIVLALSTFLSLWLGLPHGHWLALTAAIILKPAFHDSRTRALERMGGTLAGCVLAFVAAVLLRHLFCAAACLFLFVSFLAYRKNYAVYATFWTPVVVFLIDPAAGGSWLLALDRLALTLGGGALSMAALFLFPAWERGGLLQRTARCLTAARALAGTIACAADGREEELQSRRSRFTLYGEYLALAAVLERAVREPGRPKQGAGLLDAIRCCEFCGALIAVSFVRQARGDGRSAASAAMMERIAEELARTAGDVCMRFSAEAAGTMRDFLRGEGKPVEHPGSGREAEKRVSSTRSSVDNTTGSCTIEAHPGAPMTPRENLSLLVSGASPRWIPFTLDVGGSEGFTTSIQRRFEKETGAKDPAEYFDFDFRTAELPRKFGGDDPRHWSPDAPAGTVFDEWGIGHWAGGAEDTYERMFAPLAAVTSEKHVAAFPEPIVKLDGVEKRVAEYQRRGYPVMGYSGSVYEWSWWLRGMEQFMVDTLENPGIAAAIVDKVAGFTARLALENAAAGFDVLAFYDDAGSQAGMQISPAQWRSLIKPAWKRVLDTVRARYPKAVFFLHSCGNITDIVPDVVELGFHILHPVQPECMDPAAMKAAYGSRIVLCATLGAQRTLSLCSAEEVSGETARVMDTIGADKRCIVCPSNRIQPETPWENVLAFVSAARNHRFGKAGVGAR